MSSDWRWLRADETVVWDGRPRLTTIVGSVVLGLLVVVGAVGLAVTVDPRLVAVGILGVPLPIWDYFRVKNTSYLVTTRAVWLKTGVFGRSVRRVTISRVQNTSYRQSVRGSLFGYGTVTVDVAGGEDIEFERISNPRSVQEGINDQRNRRENADRLGTVEQWQAVLSAVRGIRQRIEDRSAA